MVATGLPHEFVDVEAVELFLRLVPFAFLADQFLEQFDSALLSLHGLGDELVFGSDPFDFRGVGVVGALLGVAGPFSQFDVFHRILGEHFAALGRLLLD